MTDPDDIYYDRISDVQAGDSVDITLEELDEEYELSDDAIVYWNFVHADADDVGGDWEDADVMVVIEDDVIVTLLAIQYFGSAVITDIDYDDEEVWLLLGSAAVEKVELGDYDIVLLMKDGAVLDFEDVQLWDVAHYAEYEIPGGDDVLFLDMVDEKVSGELEEIGADSDDHVILTVDGEDYTVDEDGTCSPDGNDSFEVLDEGTVEDFAGQDVSVYLDKYGDARHVVADLEEEAAPATIGMVVWVDTGGYWYEWGPPGDEQFYVKLITPDGTTKRYEWDDDTFFSVLEFLNDGDEPEESDEMANEEGLGFLNNYLENGSVVEFSLTDEGLLDSITELHFEEPGWDMDEGDIDADHDVIDYDGIKYKAVRSTAIFDDCAGDEDAYSWDTFEDIDIADNDIWSRMYRDGDATINVLVVNSGEEGVSFPGIADVGVVLKRVVTRDGTAYKILVEDETGQYLAEDADIYSLEFDNWEWDFITLADIGDVYDILATTDGHGGFADIDVGDLVSFELDSAGEEFTFIDELNAAFWPVHDGEDGDDGEDGIDGFWPFHYAWINEGGIDPENLILNVRCDEDKDEYEGLDYFDLVLTEDTIIYDVTGATPELASFEDLEEDQCIQFFDVDEDGLVDYVKITEAYEPPLPPA